MIDDMFYRADILIRIIYLQCQIRNRETWLLLNNNQPGVFFLHCPLLQYTSMSCPLSLSNKASFVQSLAVRTPVNTTPLLLKKEVGKQRNNFVILIYNFQSYGLLKTTLIQMYLNATL